MRDEDISPEMQEVAGHNLTAGEFIPLSGTRGESTRLMAELISADHSDRLIELLDQDARATIRSWLQTLMTQAEMIKVALIGQGMDEHAAMGASYAMVHMMLIQIFLKLDMVADRPMTGVWLTTYPIVAE